MPIYTVTTTAQVVATAGRRWLFSNSGAANVFLTWAEGGVTRSEVVVAGAPAMDFTPGGDVTARTTSGSASLVATAAQGAGQSPSVVIRGGTALPRTTDIGLRADTAAGWAAQEAGGPALNAGEDAWVGTDIVRGDGVTTVASLPRAGSGTYVRPDSVGSRMRTAMADARPDLIGTVMTVPPLLTQNASNPGAQLTAKVGVVSTTPVGAGSLALRGGGPVVTTATSYILLPAVTQISGGNVSATQNAAQQAVEWYSDAPLVMIRYIGNAAFARGLMIEVDGQRIAPKLQFATSGAEYCLMEFSVGSATIVAATGVFTVTPPTGVTGHNLKVGDQVVLGTITTTTGITAKTVPYWVLTTPSETTFTLSAAPDGAAVSLTGNGSTLSVCVAKPRRFRYEFEQSAGPFDGVYVAPGYSVWRPPTNLRVAVVGDSTVVNTGCTRVAGGWQARLAKMMGWDDLWSIGIGGTGWVATTAVGGTFGSASRVADAVACDPDALILIVSQNDVAGAALTAAVLAGLQAYRTALPDVPIVMGGVLPGTSGPSAGILAVEASAKAAFDAWADGNSWWIPISTATDTNKTNPWIFGTGSIGATTGDGNADALMASTGHPSQAGHDYLAQRWASALRALVIHSSRLV
jgi:lysophospholipase L1-like esterase